MTHREEYGRWTRREMLAAAGRSILGLSVAGLLGGCSSGSDSTGVQQTGSGVLATNENVFVYAHQVPVGTSGNQPVGTLLDNANIGGTNFNAVYWGVKDASGTPISVTQAAVWTNDPNKSAQLLFDASGRPSQLTDVNGVVRLSFDWKSDTSVTLTVFDPASMQVGGSVITFSGDAYTISPLPSKSVALRSGSPVTALPIRSADAIAIHRADGGTINDFIGIFSKSAYISNQVSGVSARLNLTPTQNLGTLFTAALLNANLPASGSLSFLAPLRPADSAQFAVALAKLVTTNQPTPATLQLLNIPSTALDATLLFALAAFVFLREVAPARARKAQAAGIVLLIDGDTLSQAP